MHKILYTCDWIVPIQISDQVKNKNTYIYRKHSLEFGDNLNMYLNRIPKSFGQKLA